MTIRSINAQDLTPSSTLSENKETEIFKLNLGTQISRNPQLTPMSEIPKVFQLRDVSPTDWAYEALRSLVERYGCVTGYPDGTFRGNRALSRWEFAGGLNACLNVINNLIGEGQAVLRDDLDKLQRLAQEFKAELDALGARIDNLESRVAFLEDHQFSTTTILRGNAIFALSDVFQEDDDNETIFEYRVNLNFISSFTGRDVLLLSMFAGNNRALGFNREGGDFQISPSFNLPGVEVSIPRTSRTITFSSAEGTLSSQFAANTGNSLQILTMGYSFPVGKNLNVAVLSSLAPFQVYAPTLNPYLDDKDSGTGAISIFGEYNPLYTLIGGGTGAVFNYKITPDLKLTGGYLADGLFAANPEPGAGLFNGGYGILGQLTWTATKNFSLAGVYMNDYSPPGRFGFNYNALAVTGTAVANTLAGQDFPTIRRVGLDQAPAITNGYGIQFNWQPSSKFSFSGWLTGFNTRLINTGDGNIWTYALTFAFPDLGKQGNLLGLVVGAEPYLTDFDGGNPQPFERDVPWHIEGFYRHQLNDRISLTPGFIWLLAPNQDNDNPDAVIGTIRMTFQF